jgi:hypothetical protein
MSSPLVIPGLVPGIQPTTVAEQAARWISVTPAFAGAGKHRDDAARFYRIEVQRPA